MIRGQDTFGSVLLAQVVKRFGLEVLSWNTETLTTELERAKIDLDLSAANKLFGAMSLVKSDAFYLFPYDFTLICHALDGDVLVDRAFIPLEPVEMCWGVFEAWIIWPPEAGFSEENKAYMREILKNNSIFRTPTVLQPIIGPALELTNPDFLGKDLATAVFHEQVARAEEVDQEIKQRADKLFAQLRALSIDLSKEPLVARG